MGIAIHCVLEQPMIGLPELDGKMLCAAFCSDPGESGTDEDMRSADNLVLIDFGNPRAASDLTSQTESVFGPLGQFVTGDSGVVWHEPTAGLIVVRAILEKLRSGARVFLDPDLGFLVEDEDEVTDAVADDLEALEQILTAAQRQETRFRLVTDA